MMNWSRKRNWSGFAFVIFFTVLFSLMKNVIANGPPPVQNPTAEEQQLFQQKLNRLNGHQGQIPAGGGVSDVITSLSQTVTKTFHCPDIAEITKVTININTKLVKWDKDLAKKYTGQSNCIGACFCYPAMETVGNEKKIDVTFYIMLDPSVTKRDEGNAPVGQMLDEGLLYHELLHAQLLINAMSNNQDWQKKVCQCQFPYDPMDYDHSTIYGLVNSFLENLAAPERTVVTARPPAQPAKDDQGNFEVEIADKSILGEKLEFTWNAYVPDGGNVNENSLDVIIKGDKIILKGKLIDKTKSGFVIVRIDPPTVVLAVAIETGVVILPKSPIPTLTQWGLIILAILITGTAIWVLLRRRRVVTA